MFPFISILNNDMMKLTMFLVLFVKYVSAVPFCRYNQQHCCSFILREKHDSFFTLKYCYFMFCKNHVFKRSTMCHIASTPRIRLFPECLLRPFFIATLNHSKTLNNNNTISTITRLWTKVDFLYFEPYKSTLVWN